MYLKKNIESYWVTSRDIDIDKDGKHILPLNSDFPFMIRQVHFYIDFNLTPNYHDYLEITYVLKGVGTYITGQNKYFIRKGDVFSTNNIELHTWVADHNKTLDLLSFFFLPDFIYKPGDNDSNLEFLAPFFNRGKYFNPRIPNSTSTEKIYKLITKMHSNIINKNRFLYITSKTLLQEIILMLLNHHKDNITRTSTIYNQNFKEIERLKNVFILMNNEFDQNITLEQAASTVCISVPYFCSVFKKVTGSTFKEYLVKLRIDKAKELLLKYNLSVIDIAFQVGFQNLSYFYRAFKKLTSVNPKEFRSIFKNR